MSGQKELKNKIITRLVIYIVIVIIIAYTAAVVIPFIQIYDTSPKNAFSEYDNKIYSVSSENGKIQGFIASKTVSCGEFPSDVCLNTYYNFLLKEPLNVAKGEMTFSDFIGAFGYLEPVYCDVDISKINPFEEHSSDSLFSCGSDSNNRLVKSYFVSALKISSSSGSLLNIPDVGTINVYDLSDSNRKLIKTYQIKIQPIN
jgi:hypothetical protein